MKKNWSELTVWITGASAGIGAALAKECSKHGAHVILSARREDALKAVQGSLSNPEKSLILPLDLMNYEQGFQSELAEALSHTGRIDLVIHNAGISQRSEAVDTHFEVYKQVMDINYFGTLALNQAILPVMKKQGAGHMAAITSLTGKFGFHMRSGYAASKHALHGYFESVAMEEQDWLHVTMLCPGFIRTDISKNALDAKGSKTGEMDKNQAEGMPPEKCAQLIIKAIDANKKEAVMGKGALAVKLKRYWPWLFWKVVAKRSGTGS